MARNGTSEHTSSRRRRADALALIAEESVRSYRSWIAELDSEPSDGIDRRRYAYEHLAPGEVLVLVRERTDSKTITPYRTTIAPFTSVTSLSNIIGLPRHWTMEFASRSLSKKSRSVGSSVGALSSSERASSSFTMAADGHPADKSH